MWQTNGSSMPQVYASVSGADKLRLIQAHENDEDYHEVARVLGIKRTTAWAIIRRHQHTGAVRGQEEELETKFARLMTR